MTYSSTYASTYTQADIATVMRRFKADLRMMAESTDGMTLSKAEDYGADIELLAKKGALEWIDVTLFDAGVEERAVRYTVDTDSGELSSSRPGGVLWPRFSSPKLRIIIHYATGGRAIKEQLWQRGDLNINWSPTDEDTSHSSLSSNGGRIYNSNGYGMNRQDYSR